MTALARPDLAHTLHSVIAEDRGRLLSALIRELRDFQLAEDCLQDAAEAALLHWRKNGVPARPEAWLLRVARRKAIDRFRRARRFRDREADLAILARADEVAASDPPPDIPDQRLRLIFTCCHPALEPKTQVALTLRALGGLTTPQIARAFLDTDIAMGQRLSRAKAKIRKAGIPYAVPGPEAWAERLNSVLNVIYLIFNEGYGADDAGAGATQVDLCGEAIYLARLVNRLRPNQAEVLGLLALLLLTHARHPARRDGTGAMVPLDAQDRNLWDKALITEGLAALDHAMALRVPGPFQIKAAMSALHAEAPDYGVTDWRQMLMLYDALYRMEPTPVVQLNRAIVLAETGAVTAALSAVDMLASELAAYQPYHAARADLLVRAGRLDLAEAAYDKAIGLSRNALDAEFLKARKKALGQKKGRAKLGQSPTGRYEA